MSKLDTHGEGNKQAKLNETKVRGLRRAYESGAYTQRDLARHYDISLTQVHRIVHNVDWKHVPTYHPSNKSVTNKLNKGS